MRIVNNQVDLEEKFANLESEDNTLENMYGKDDLSNFPLFGGGFINFGYWPSIQDLKTKTISLVDREESQKQMYEEVVLNLGISNNDEVLEVGSGLGLGASWIVNKYKPRRYVGIDASPEQVERSNIKNISTLASAQNFTFKVCKAENLTFEAESFNKILSVEAAQHFRNLNAFFEESHRVLKSNGRLVIATFFSTRVSAIEELKQRIPTIQEQIDRVPSIDSVLASLKSAGFKRAEAKSIGENVWYGFDQWQDIVGFNSGWNKNWMKSYKDDLVDYYMVTAQK